MSLQYVEDVLDSEFSPGGFFYEARHWNLDLELAYVALNKLDKISADGLTPAKECGLLILSTVGHSFCRRGFIKDLLEKTSTRSSIRFSSKSIGS